ncbi:MAG: hypothetical protein V7704_00695 [Aurantimonas endophytica]
MDGIGERHPMGGAQGSRFDDHRPRHRHYREPRLRGKEGVICSHRMRDSVGQRLDQAFGQRDLAGYGDQRTGVDLLDENALVRR